MNKPYLKTNKMKHNFSISNKIKTKILISHFKLTILIKHMYIKITHMYITCINKNFQI